MQKPLRWSFRPRRSGPPGAAARRRCAQSPGMLSTFRFGIARSMPSLPSRCWNIFQTWRALLAKCCVSYGVPDSSSLACRITRLSGRRSRIDWLRRDRRAFGVERGRGAWRWFKRNAGLAWRKRFSSGAEFLYRQPILHATAGGDADAVYYAAPIDLLRFFRDRGAALVTSSALLRLGWAGRCLPVEFQGSTVMAWRVTDRTVSESPADRV